MGASGLDISAYISANLPCMLDFQTRDPPTIAIATLRRGAETCTNPREGLARQAACYASGLTDKEICYRAGHYGGSGFTPEENLGWCRAQGLARIPACKWPSSCHKLI